VNGKLAIDTNAVIAYREGNYNIGNLIENADLLFLPVIVFGELLYGAINSTQVHKNKQAVQILLSYSILIPIDESIAIRYANIRFNLKNIGRPIPENDIWIAASCLELDLPLLTIDSHFDHIQDLKVIKWE
jgi:tRNA(fMet)-specific endonuclease VapC